MFQRVPTVVCVNPDCSEQTFLANRLLYICPRGKRCKGFSKREFLNPEVNKLWPNDSLFVSRKYQYAASCPYDGEIAYLKVCPYCGERQPVSTGNMTTIAVIGASSSGKTCFITGLVKRIQEELVRRERLRAAVQWDDQEGYDFYKEAHRIIYQDHKLPKPTRVETRMKTMQITVRVPKRGWSLRWSQLLMRCSFDHWGQPSHCVSLVFPDPSGEILESLEKPYYVNYLSQARAIILMVDPFASSKYRTNLENKGVLDARKSNKVVDPSVVLTGIVTAIRNRTKRLNRALKQDIAVVLTKCDEPDLIDPDSPQFRQPKQGQRYNIRSARNLSESIRDFLENDLGMANVATLAEQHFRHHCFFAVSPLGRPPVVVGKNSDGDPIYGLVDPAPRFTEDPFLWILHQWGYI